MTTAILIGAFTAAVWMVIFWAGCILISHAWRSLSDWVAEWRLKREQEADQ